MRYSRLQRRKINAEIYIRSNQFFILLTLSDPFFCSLIFVIIIVQRCCLIQYQRNRRRSSSFTSSKANSPFADSSSDRTVVHGTSGIYRLSIRYTERASCYKNWYQILEQYCSLRFNQQ